MVEARSDAVVPLVLDTAVGDVVLCSNDNPLCFETTRSSRVAFKQCSRCKNVMYCSDKCQKAHWKSHSCHCFSVGDVNVRTKTEAPARQAMVWAVLLPAQRQRKPYAVLVPSKSLADRDAAMRKLMRMKTTPARGAIPSPHGSGSASACQSPDGEEIMEIFSVCRGEPRECFDLCMVWDHANTAGPVNLRASAMQTRPDGGANLFAIDGPEVRVRGDAVLFRAHSTRDDTNKTINVRTKEPIRDLFLSEFNARFGVFSMTAVPTPEPTSKSDDRQEGGSWASSTLLPLTAANDEMIALQIQRGVAASQ